MGSTYSKQQTIINLSAMLLYIKGTFVFNTVYFNVSLHYKHNICSTWFIDIRLSVYFGIWSGHYLIICCEIAMGIKISLLFWQPHWFMVKFGGHQPCHLFYSSYSYVVYYNASYMPPAAITIHYKHKT